MGNPVTLNREKAVAVQEAVRTVERLLGEEGANERLFRAQHDVVGRTMQDFVLSVLVAELVRVVAAQQERIDGLEKSLELLGKGEGEPAGPKG